jgi:hypothetical protein
VVRLALVGDSTSRSPTAPEEHRQGLTRRQSVAAGHRSDDPGRADKRPRKGRAPVRRSFAGLNAFT